MLYGNCISFRELRRVKILKETGFDYVEVPLSPMHSAKKEEIEEFAEALEKEKMRCAAVNVLFPGDLRLTGKNAEPQKAGDYIEEIFEKTKSLKFEKVVFGSGGARKVPEGFGMEAAMGQIVKIIEDHLVPAAEKYGFAIAIEELNKGETNILNSLAECAELAKRINNPKVLLLADLYHIGMENDDLGQLPGYGGILAHCHIANPKDSRFYPQASDSPESIALYKKFFSGLKSAGYGGGISIEGNLGKIKDISELPIPEWVGEDDRLFYAESKKSLEFMRSIQKSN